jgi:Domain of unknown function (DUF1833)
MNPLLSEALKQAYALAPATVEHVHTLQIEHVGVSEPIFIVQGHRNRVCTVPGLGATTFLAAPFRFTLPATDDGGLQELNLTFDNVDPLIAEFCRSAQTYPAPVEIQYRPYLSTDLTTPQMDPALLLYLTNVVITLTEISGRAVPRDFLNREFPNFRYTTTNFPGLRNL